MSISRRRFLEATALSEVTARLQLSRTRSGRSHFSTCRAGRSCGTTESVQQPVCTKFLTRLSLCKGPLEIVCQPGQ